MGEAGEPGGEGPEGPGGDGGGARLTESQVDLEILSAEIAEDGTVTVELTVTDAEGNGLDLDGVLTEGDVTLRFVLAWLDPLADTSGPGQYTAYTTRMAMGDALGEVTQAATDSDGTFERLDLVEGRYRYTFGTTVDVVDASYTHTIAAYAEREFEGKEYVDNDVFHFVPDGSGEPETRVVVTNDACNSCHGDLSHHGGSRKDVQLCITCHTEQTPDPDTGNTTDFPVMIHKLHYGENLPSVEDGEPYRFVGYMGREHDYSHVTYPQTMQRCTTCHQGEDADLWSTRASIRNCQSCHDRTAFEMPVPEGFVLHTAGPREDNECVTCHSEGGEFAGVATSHAIPETSDLREELTLTILGIDDTMPGDNPTLRFRVEVDGSPRDITSDDINGLEASIAGPNEGYASYVSERFSGEDVTTIDASAGEFAYTFGWTVPTDAVGSYTVGLVGNTVLLWPPTAPMAQQDAVRLPAHAVTMPFAVGTGDAIARRMIVSSEKCNSCHAELSEHGGQRTNPDYCVMCHIPSNANEGRFARVEGTTEVVPTTDFRVMIHKIHAGESLTQQPYVLGGFPPPRPDDPDGSPIDFGEVTYPGALNDCSTCHVGDSYQLPLGESLQPTVIPTYTCDEDPGADANDFCNDWVEIETDLVPPATAVCTSCHDDRATAVHAELMTDAMGNESCAVCHGPGSGDSVSVAHNQMDW